MNQDWNANNNVTAYIRAALADTQDWDEIKALRASLREHMAEIHRLRTAGWHAYYALSEIDSPLLVREITIIGAAMSGLRAALAEEKNENTVQSTGGVHSRVSDGANCGVEAVTDCHEKEGDKLAFPLSTLAVHVGYRYQNPVGDWEYGDHIPAGFDTDKWAHQKIYILQEQ